MDCFEILDFDNFELDMFYEDTPMETQINDVLAGVLQAQRDALQTLKEQVDELRTAQQKKIRHWTPEEHSAFVAALEHHHYKQARYIADRLGGWTRNQVATHGQKFVEKVCGRVR